MTTSEQQEQTDPGPGRLITIDEAAAQAGLHPQTIRRYLDQGRLTRYRVGVKLIRVDREQVDALTRPVGQAS